jgi:AcrR family transcriptional regulator
MAQKQLTRKERDRLRHRQEILDKALKLFTEHGFHNVSMQQIARASEFAVGTLYNFFESKDALFDEITRSCVEQIVGALSAIIDGPGNEAQRLRAFIRYHPRLLEEHEEFVKLYVSVLGPKARKLPRNRDENHMGNVLDSKVEQLIEAGISKGIFRSVDPVITAKAISSTMQTVSFETVGLDDKARITDIFSKVEQLFIDGLLIPESGR